jgi:hypothetical protein
MGIYHCSTDEKYIRKIWNKRYIAGKTDKRYCNTVKTWLTGNKIT